MAEFEIKDGVAIIPEGGNEDWKLGFQRLQIIAECHYTRFDNRD